MPSLSITPARITDPAVGAWVWASGSHVCTGKSGTLTAKAMAKAKNSQRAGDGGEVGPFGDHREVEGDRPDPVVAGDEHGGDDADEHEGRAEHREQEELAGRVEAVVVAPAADEEVHRHEHDLEEDEEHEQVEAEERTEHAGLEHEHPPVVLLEVAPERRCFPGGVRRFGAGIAVVRVGADDGEREQHAGEHDEQQRDAVDAEVPRDAPLRDPLVDGHELEAGVAGVEVAEQPDRQRAGDHGGAEADEAHEVGSPVRRDRHRERAEHRQQHDRASGWGTRAGVHQANPRDDEPGQQQHDADADDRGVGAHVAALALAQLTGGARARAPGAVDGAVDDVRVEPGRALERLATRARP